MSATRSTRTANLTNFNRDVAADRDFEPGARQKSRILTTLKSPERSSRPKDYTRDSNCRGHRRPLTVTFLTLTELQWHRRSIDSRSILHGPCQLTGSAPGAASLRLCHTRCRTRTCGNDG